jgi:hypothetical protein
MGTGAATIMPKFSLAVDTIVTIECRSCPPISEMFPALSGFQRVSEVVTYDPTPFDSIAFGPGQILRLPLLAEFSGVFSPAKELRLFEFDRRTGQFLDAGVIAHVGPLGRFAFAPNVETFGTFAVFEQVGAPPSADSTVATPAASSDSCRDCEGTFQFPVYFPLVVQEPAQKFFTRLSLVNVSDQPAEIWLRAFNSGGESKPPLAEAPVTVMLPASQQVSLGLNDPALFGSQLDGDSWSIVGCSNNPQVTGMCELTDANPFTDPPLTTAKVLASATASFSQEPALIFPILKREEAGFREIHLFNAGSQMARVKLCLYKESTWTLTCTECDPIGPRQRLVISDSQPACLNLGALGDAENGYIFVQVVEGNGVVGAHLFGQMNSDGTPKTLAVLNGLPLPQGFVFDETAGEASSESSSSSALTHTVYATYFERTAPSSQVVKTDVFLINATQFPARMDVTPYMNSGQEGTRLQAFRTLVPHGLYRGTAENVSGVSPPPPPLPDAAGYLRIELPDAGVVGIQITRVMKPGATVPDVITAVPLGFNPKDLLEAVVPQGASDEAFLSRIKQDRGLNPLDSTAFLVLNPNGFGLGVTVNSLQPSGFIAGTGFDAVPPRGTYFPSLDPLSNGVAGLIVTGQSVGSLKGMTEAFPQLGEKIVAVGIYRRGGRFRPIQFLSVVPAQVRLRRRNATGELLPCPSSP